MKIETPQTTAKIDTIQGTITTLTIDGGQLTRRMARQLDELRFESWAGFKPIGRIRSGIEYGGSFIELLGTDTSSGALVRMAHDTRPIFAAGLQDPHRDVRDTLTDEYTNLPLIILGE